MVPLKSDFADFAKLDRLNVEQFATAVPVQFSAVLQV